MADAGRADTSRRFDELIARYVPDPQVSLGTGFGKSRGLRVGGKVFAIFGERDLTLKLPGAKVDELVDAGAGTRFNPGHGREMREWVTIPDSRAREWAVLADQARDFVRPR